MQIYALTQRDVDYIGMAAVVNGGGVTAWGEEDNTHSLPTIIEQTIKDKFGRRGRWYLGTIAGLDYEIRLDKEIVEEILKESDEHEKRMTSNHRIIIEGNARREMWRATIKKWMDKL